MVAFEYANICMMTGEYIGYIAINVVSRHARSSHADVPVPLLTELTKLWRCKVYDGFRAGIVKM